MSGEIKMTVGLTVNKGGLSVTFPTKTKSIDMSGTRSGDIVQDIGTTHEAITIPSDLGTEGVTYFVNLDATNYVEIGVDVAAAFYPLLKIKPLEEYPFRLAIAAPYAKANTAPVKLRTFIAED